MDDVQQFLLQKELADFLPVCTRMNGPLLLAMHRMCVANSPVMLQSLNNELAMKSKHESARLIEVTDYLRFLDELKPYVPVKQQKEEGSHQRSSVCLIM